MQRKNKTNERWLEKIMQDTAKIYKNKHTKEDVIYVPMEDLKKFIDNITTYQIKNNIYVFEHTEAVEDLFKKTYRKPAYSIDRASKTIRLNLLNNGLRRSLYYRKKRDDYATFIRMLKRFAKDLEESFTALDVAFDVKVMNENKGRFQEIDIVIDDLKINGSNQTMSYVRYFFDTTTWEYELIYINGKKMKQVYEITNRAIERASKPTREYRKKKMFSELKGRDVSKTKK